MITDHNTKKPKIQGLLLLDCWEPTVHEHFFKDKYYINLIEHLRSYNFQWIVNSAARLKIELNDVGMANTWKICNYNDTHPIIRNLLKHSGDEKTSTLISRYVFNHHTINIISEYDFSWFCMDYLENKVQNWLVAGHTWQICTHSHALGLHALTRVAKQYHLNFYATDYSFCKMTEQTATLNDFEQDSMRWCQIENFGYQLLL